MTTRWWGYRHENGNYQVKRHYGNALTQASIADAEQSPFVVAVCPPFAAHGRRQALHRCEAILTRKGHGGPR